MVVCSLTETRLSRNALSKPVVDSPPGIVHLGLGAFARAHLAEYVRKANDLQPNEPWYICGVSLRNPNVRDALRPQDGVYTIVERDGPRSRPNDRFVVCDSVSEVLYAGDDAAAIQERLVSADTRIISMTVTEKGYCRLPDGTLDTNNRDVAHDIRALGVQPDAVVKSLPGWLAQAIVARSRRDLPVTVISLDNLPNNGRSLRRVVCAMLSYVDEQALGWLEAGNVTFPSSVLDRIVPATTDEDRRDVAAQLKCHDAWPVVTEPYNNWVLENHFCSGQPHWSDAGVTLVADATPFEEAKLRLLNGPHSFIAYLGQLTDRETVADVMAEPQNQLAVQCLMAEAEQTLNMPDSFDLSTYQREIVARFHNEALRHHTAQIAMDGSEKIPQRWLAVIESLRSQRKPARYLACALALWIRYLHGSSETGAALTISDPRVEQLASIVSETSEPVQIVADVFRLLDSSLADDVPLVNSVAQFYTDLVEGGVAVLIGRLIGGQIVQR